jgi:hypothetical protein
MNNVNHFEVGKTYQGTYGKYTIIKRTKCFVELNDGRRCKVSECSLGKGEAIYFKKWVSYWGLMEKELEGVYAHRVCED